MSFLGQPLRWRALREKGLASTAAFVAGTARVLRARPLMARPLTARLLTAATIAIALFALVPLMPLMAAGSAQAQSLRHDLAPEKERGAAAPSSLPTWLPKEATATYRLILSGGPFPYGNDSVVFGNREHLLPAERRGFYHEYTVPTPGAHDRGARRIVCGGNPPVRPVACFYTGDHYASFQPITH